MIQTNLAKCCDEIAKLRKECSATNEVSRKSSELDKVDKNIETPFKFDTEITPKNDETIAVFLQHCDQNE